LKDVFYIDKALSRNFPDEMGFYKIDPTCPIGPLTPVAGQRRRMSDE
jgi:hypothetical protein